MPENGGGGRKKPRFTERQVEEIVSYEVGHVSGQEDEGAADLHDSHLQGDVHIHPQDEPKLARRLGMKLGVREPGETTRAKWVKVGDVIAWAKKALRKRLVKRTV